MDKKSISGNLHLVRLLCEKLLKVIWIWCYVLIAFLYLKIRKFKVEAWSFFCYRNIQHKFFLVSLDNHIINSVNNSFVLSCQHASKVFPQHLFHKNFFIPQFYYYHYLKLKFNKEFMVSILLLDIAKLISWNSNTFENIFFCLIKYFTFLLVKVNTIWVLRMWHILKWKMLSFCLIKYFAFLVMKVNTNGFSIYL